MPISHEAKLIDDIAHAVRETANQLTNQLPQAAMALNHVAITVGQAGERYERHRIDSILKGTHPSLMPVKMLVSLPTFISQDHAKYNNDFSLVPLLLPNCEDEAPLTVRNMASENERLFKRFVGAMFRHHYVLRGFPPTDGGTFTLKALHGVPAVPHTYTLVDGDIVMTFPDVNHAFEHTITLGKFYTYHNTNQYTVRSTWLDESFTFEFGTIGWQWMQAHVMASVCSTMGFGPEDYVAVTDEELLAAYLAIEGASGILMYNNITLQYPGSLEEGLPKSRIDVSYHYYSGSASHKLTINVYPDQEHLLIGTDSSKPNQGHISFANAPTPLQRWIVENLHVGVEATLAELEAERLANGQ